MHLGTAFQLIDDVLDYSGDLHETGKNLGDDLDEGKPTLPLIHVMRTRHAGADARCPARDRGGRARRRSPQCSRRSARPARSTIAREQAQAEARARLRRARRLPAIQIQANLCYNWPFAVERNY